MLSLRSYFLLFGFVLLGTVSRLVPHLPNCTAMNAIALFGVYSLGGWRPALGVVFGTLLLSDLMLGLHATLLYVYLSFGLLVLIGQWVRHARTVFRLSMLSLASSLLFFLVTNFGSWMTSSLYPSSLQGLALCYAAGLPFLLNQVLGDLAYGILIFTCMTAWRTDLRSRLQLA